MTGGLASFHSKSGRMAEGMLTVHHGWMGLLVIGPIDSAAGRSLCGWLARLANVGGNWNNGASDGVSALNANDALSNSNANNGARLDYVLTTIQTEQYLVTTGMTLPLGKRLQMMVPGLVEGECGYSPTNVGAGTSRRGVSHA